MNRCKWTAFFAISLLLINVLTAPAVEYSGGLKIRYDRGREVNPQSLNAYPNNLTDRSYLEGLFTSDFIFDNPKFGDKLRFSLRMQEFRPSDMDKDLFQLQQERRWNDKIYAQLNWNGWELWAGDVYETFGKGLALNLFENRDLYFDTGLRGGKVVYRGEKLRFKAINGRCRDIYLVKEENVSGMNVETKPVSNMQIGAALVYQEGLSSDEGAAYKPHFDPGIYAGWNLDPVSIYAEYAQRREEDFSQTIGDGLFTSLTAFAAGVAAQFNYKYYHFGYNNSYSTPPICQREFTTKLLSTHPHVPLIDDQVGYELELSASPHGLLFLSLNFSQASQHKGNSLIPALNQDYAPFWELFLESEYYPRLDLTTRFGLGWNEEAGNNFWQKKTGALSEVIYNIDDYWSLTLLAERMWVDDIEFNQYHSDNYWAATLGRAPYGSITFSYENSTKSSIVEGDEWIGGELALTIKSQHRLTIFYGQERGGLKCTSGVCRPVQPFEGFRVGYEGRF